jgi:glucose/arabinose dehydrogenase
MAFLPDGRILVTQKGGTLVIVSANGQTVSAPVSGVPVVDAAGQGGLLDVALDPDFATDPWVYLTFSEPGAGGKGTAVFRGKLVGNTLQDPAVIFQQLPKVSGDGHFGSRLVFRNDKTLFVTLGERQLFTPAQDVTGHLGKVVRINRDGTVPSGNATTLGAGARPEIWSYGHRNPQGAALHPSTGELWMTEHGPQGGDEVNISRVGNNYGWPVKSYGCNYGDPVVNNDNTACRIGGGVHAPAYVEPLTFWVPFSVAPSGLCFYTGSLFPEWQGNLFMGALAGQALWRLTLNGNTVASREALFPGARVRAVKQGPDGALYMLTDRIVRIAR